MTQLSDLSAPDSLLEIGFEKREEETTEPERRVWYRRWFGSDQSNVIVVLEVEFWLVLQDDPTTSYSGNCDYSWNGCFIRIIDRQMVWIENQRWDEKSEQRRLVGRLKLKTETLEDVKTLIAQFNEMSC